LSKDPKHKKTFGIRLSGYTLWRKKWIFTNKRHRILRAEAEASMGKVVEINRQLRAAENDGLLAPLPPLPPQAGAVQFPTPAPFGPQPGADRIFNPAQQRFVHTTPQAIYTPAAGAFNIQQQQQQFLHNGFPCIITITPKISS
jgi:hypothetical protein